MIWFASLEKLDTFPGQGRKGCKTTKKASEDKKTKFVTDMEFIKITPEKSDQ